MSKLRIYGDQSGYLDLVAPDSARNNVINLDGLINKDSNGNVGIGTDTPVSKLDVGGEIRLDGVITAQGTTGGVDGRIAFSQDGEVRGWIGVPQWSGEGAMLIYGPDSDGPNASIEPFVKYVNSQLELRTNNINRIVIDSNGFVGIGTDTPAYKLEVAGNLRVAGNFIVDGTTTTINSTTLNVDDLNITVASGAADAAAADGAGLTVDGANATLTYVNAGDNWNFNKDLNLDSDLIFTNRVSTDGHIKLWNGDAASGYAIGIESFTLYNRAAQKHRWYIGTYADGGTSDYMELTTTGLNVNGTVTSTKFVGHDYYSAYASSVITLTNTDAVVPINTQLASSSGSVFTLSGGRVTVTKAGTYMITYDVTTNTTSGSGRSDSRALLYKNGSAVTGTESRMYNRLAGYGETTGSATVILTLAANDIIDVRASRNSGSDTIATLANASRLTIKEV